MARHKAWFAPKRYGYGAGLPVTWQGWAMLAGSIVVAVLVAAAAEEYPALLFAMLLPMTVSLVLVASRRTRGGWHWRWGE